MKDMRILHMRKPAKVAIAAFTEFTFSILPVLGLRKSEKGGKK
jgi:hypothetical protein